MLNRNPKRIAELQYYLAVLYSDAGDVSKAVDQIGANLRYLQQHDDGPTRAANYLLMINLFEKLNNTAMQKLYWQKYAALDKRSWPVEDKIIAYINVAETFTNEGKLKEAEVNFRLALYFASRTPVLSSYISYILQSLGTIAREQGHYQKAIVLIQRAFDKAKAMNILGDMCIAKRELAATYLVLQRSQEALREARYALLLARQNKEMDGLIASINGLGTILEAQGQYKQALQYYREEQKLKEQKYAEANIQKIAQMEAQFDTETKRNTIKLLQKNDQINRLNVLRQQEELALAWRTELAAGLVIGLLVVVLALIMYGLRKSRRSNALLTQQKILLQQTASQLAETNAVKDKLFSLIGHDLRSPVAGLKNGLRQMRTFNQKTDQFPTLMDRLDKQVDNVLTLLTNLLDWSMIQLKGFQSILQPVRLSDVTEEVISQASDLIEQKRLGFINQVNVAHLALADPHQLRAVVRNVVANAIKFTPAGGFIRLVSITGQDWVELQIRDTGVGMSADQLTSLYTAPEIRTGTHGEKGTGLGLRICREMLERQNGNLQIQSQEGTGTFVRIRLTLAQEAIHSNTPSVAQ
ncbi:sensor histidine kinase [Spirosoma flavus]